MTTTNNLRLGNWIGVIPTFDQWGRLFIEMTSYPMGYRYHFWPNRLYWITCLDDIPLQKIAKVEGKLFTILKFTPENTHPEWLAWTTIYGYRATVGEPFARITLTENDTEIIPESFPDFVFPNDYPGSDYRFQIYLNNEQVVFKKE